MEAFGAHVGDDGDRDENEDFPRLEGGGAGKTAEKQGGGDAGEEADSRGESEDGESAQKTVGKRGDAEIGDLELDEGAEEEDGDDLAEDGIGLHVGH